MKVLHLNHYGSYVGGVEGYIADVSYALGETGHESFLAYFAQNPATNLIQGATQLIAAHSAKALLEQLSKIIDKFQPDVTYIHAIYQPIIIDWIAKQVPTLSYVHGPYLVCPGHAKYLRTSQEVCLHLPGAICLLNAYREHCCYGRNPLRHLQRLHQVKNLIGSYDSLPILVGSQFMKNLLVNSGFASEQINILPPVLFHNNGLPTANKKTNSQQILFVGRLETEKGLDLLLRALSGIRSKWELLIAGDGSKAKTFQNLADEFGILSKIRFLGWLPNYEIVSLYQKCAFVVVPSIWPEPYGRVGPEAFRQGCPVIAFNVGGISEWLKSGITGYLVPPGNVSQLQQAISTLLESPELCESMSRNAYKYGATAWNSKKHIDELIKYFHLLLGNRMCQGV